MKKPTRLFITLLLFLLLTIPIKSFAFDPNFIISDEDVLDYKSLTLGGINNFLQRNPGVLKSIFLPNKDGNLSLPAEIIYFAAIEHKISPKLLLVLLQKEQSLITDPDPVQGQFDWATGYAACDGCDVSNPSISRFKGFGKQINSAAAQFRYYMENPHEFNYKANKPTTIDGQTVVPKNTATASLYTYTPHLHGNKNFYKLWKEWFTTSYPDGSLVKTPNSDEIYLIDNGYKRKFSTFVAFSTRYNAKKVLTISETNLADFPEGSEIKFAKFALLRSPKGTIYLLGKNDGIRGISSMEVFRKIGFSPDEVEDVSFEELAQYREGRPITEETLYPTGVLMQDKTTGGVYHVKDNVKHPIWSRDLLKTKFASQNIIAKSPEELEYFATGIPEKFDDGELLTSENDSSVYVISQQKKWPIASPEVFEKLGYKWDNIIKTSDKILSLYENGETIDFVS